MKTLLVASSYLPQSISNWKNTSKHFTKINFADYGNLINAFSKVEDYDTLISIIFFEDIYSEESKNSTDLIVDSLKDSLKLNKKIYLSISYNFCKNLITSARYADYDLNEYISFKDKIYDLAKDNPNLFLIDMDKRFAELGHENIFDSRNWYFSHMRVSLLGFSEIDKMISKVIERSISACKKVLVLDCDNTLWGGVIGEDEIKGIRLGGDGIGHAFKDFQKIIKNIKKNGVLLAISSKNEEKDVWSVFDGHDEMILKKDDIVCSRINWIEKSENIIQIASELNLGLDSFVFWDDNPIEREKVKKVLPDVMVVEAPPEVEKWPKILENLFDFSKIQVTQEDINKSEQYKSRAKFNKASKEINFDKKSFLKKINLKPNLTEISESSLLRASQMSQKTNQFNMRTIRYSENDLIKIQANRNFKSFILSVKDDFGDHGQIGMFILKLDLAKKTAFLDTFLLSCRILGRDIELWMMQSVLNIVKENDIPYLQIQYLETERNKLVKEFLLDLCKDLEMKTSKNGEIMVKYPSSKSVVNIDSLYN